MAALTLMVLVAACTASSPAPTLTATKRSTTTGGVLQDSDFVSPTVEFFTGGMTDDELQNSIERAVAECMDRRGWAYEPLLQASSPANPRTVGELETYRHKYGYGDLSLDPSINPQTAPSSHAADINAAYRHKLSPGQRTQYDRDLDGHDTPTSEESNEVTAGGCRAQAQQASGAPLYNDALMSDLRTMYNEAIASSDMTNAISAWAGCMRSKGYQFKRPSDASDYVETSGSQLPSDQAVALEIEVATADFDCARFTALPVGLRIETDIVEQIRARYPEYGTAQ